MKAEKNKQNLWHFIDATAPALLNKYKAYQSGGLWELETDELKELLHEIVCDVFYGIVARKKNIEAFADSFKEMLNEKEKQLILEPTSLYLQMLSKPSTKITLLNSEQNPEVSDTTEAQ